MKMIVEIKLFVKMVPVPVMISVHKQDMLLC